MAPKRRIDREVEVKSSLVRALRKDAAAACFAKNTMYGLMAISGTTDLLAISYSLAEGRPITTDVAILGLGAAAIAGEWGGKVIFQDLQEYFAQKTESEQAELERLQGLQNL